MGMAARIGGVLALCITQSAYGNEARIALYDEMFESNPVQVTNPYPWLFAGGTYHGSRGSFSAAADGDVLFNAKQTSEYYFDVRETYAAFSPGSGAFSAAVGRKLEDWSELDSFWQLGMWQPRFRRDPLAPDQNGLTGFFADYRSGVFRATAFGSPVHIPEIGPQLKIENGTVSSTSRFASVPPSQVPLFGGEIPVNYSLALDSISQILFHPSAGAMLRAGAERGPWVRASYAYQPVQRLMLGYEGYLQVDQRDVEVTVHPRVVYHHLVGLDGGYAGDHWRASLSTVAERPVMDETPDSWTTEQLSPAFLMSPEVAIDFRAWGARPSHLALSYLYSTGGTAPDQGPLASPPASLFESRYPFRNAMSAALDFPLWALTVSTRSIYDYSVGGVFLSLDVGYASPNRWALAVGSDVIGSSSQAAPDGGADYFYLNRSNDRIRGKVTYYF